MSSWVSSTLGKTISLATHPSADDSRKNLSSLYEIECSSARTGSHEATVHY
jgi:hypothetical protein